ncbi:hypothetical protein NITMOv2_0649 [Nitrospira moscoviensis]|uniref:Uncharacterized protein n=1 Tax=Nitrospira moscoviensis TaxID=42253 RepID=A0A0K2G828_NITMO|nr:hypothetical protein NITMOv2_0649 [Nitrospira moscoviensis]
MSDCANDGCATEERTGEGSTPKAQSCKRRAGAPRAVSSCAGGTEAIAPIVRRFKSSSRCHICDRWVRRRPGSHRAGKGARNGCSEPGWIDRTCGGLVSVVAASCATSLLPANPITLDQPCFWVSFRPIRAAVSMQGPKSFVMPVRSRKSEPSLIDSQAGANGRMCCSNSPCASCIRDKSGGMTRRPGQSRRAASTDMPGWRPSRKASSEISRITARGVWTGATATGLFRNDASPARASATPNEGMCKQTICRSISHARSQWLQMKMTMSMAGKPLRVAQNMIEPGKDALYSSSMRVTLTMVQGAFHTNQERESCGDRNSAPYPSHSMRCWRKNDR